MFQGGTHLSSFRLHPFGLFHSLGFREASEFSWCLSGDDYGCLKLVRFPCPFVNPGIKAARRLGTRDFSRDFFSVESTSNWLVVDVLGFVLNKFCLFKRTMLKNNQLLFV